MIRVHHHPPSNSALQMGVSVMALGRQGMTCGRADLAMAAHTAIDASMWGRNARLMILIKLGGIILPEEFYLFVSRHDESPSCARIGRNLGDSFGFAESITADGEPTKRIVAWEDAPSSLELLSHLETRPWATHLPLSRWSCGHATEWLGVVATLILVSAVLVPYAVAQPHGGGGGFAAPHMSAPAPHIAPPMPHLAAPSSHFTAQQMVAPHFAGPHVAHVPVERMAPPGPGSVATHNLGAGLSQAPRPAGGLRQGGATPSAVVQGPGAHNPNLAQTSRTLIQGANHRQIVRNPAFAGLPSRDPATRTLARSTFQGRFAQSGFAREFDGRRHRGERFGIVLGFVGPLFWPYAYDDFIDYTFWPYAYDTFWPYAFDDVYEGIYGGYAPEYYPSRRGRLRIAKLTEGATRICTGEAVGLTDFPIERITQQIQPDQDQQRLLDDLKAGTAKAVDILRAACPTELPSTPTGRLAAMRQRVEAMLQAVQVVRPALEKFYGSLSDEQKERFNALAMDRPVDSSRTSHKCAGDVGPKSPIYRLNRSSGRFA